MRGIASELLFALVFIGVLVVQYLMKRRARQAPGQEVPARGPARAPHEAFPGAADLERLMAGARPPPSADRPVFTDAPAAARAYPRRRFARQALLGTRRDAQNAVVIAAIIGPCRALEPPGGETVPVPPRRTARPRQEQPARPAAAS